MFGLTEEELIVPEFARYEAGSWCCTQASGSFTLRQLNDSLDRTRTTHHTVGTLPKLELRPGTSLAEPNATKIIPESGCALGIDIGSPVPILFWSVLTVNWWTSISAHRR